MKVEQAFALIENQLRAAGRKVDRLELRETVKLSVNTLLSSEDWVWATKYLNPAIRTTANYDRCQLPSDFGSNFLRGGKDGDDYAVKINDGSVDSDLCYEPPETFFSRSRQGLGNQKPTGYTIQRVSGAPWIFLFHTPDSAYDIWGAYKPEFYEFEEYDEDIPVPGMFTVWDSLTLLDPQRGDWMQRRDQALHQLYVAESHKPQFYPQLGERNALSAYDPMRL